MFPPQVPILRGTLAEGAGGLQDAGGVHFSGHVGLLLEFGLQQRVLDHADPHVHLNDLLLQLRQALLNFHHRSCEEIHRGTGQRSRGQHEEQTKINAASPPSDMLLPFSSISCFTFSSSSLT